MAVAAALGVAALAGCESERDRAARETCDEPFDRTAWEDMNSIEPTQDGESRRAILADGLVVCDTLIGARPARVRRLLGEPDDGKGRQSDGARTWRYLLGPDPLMIDSEILVVVFRRGRVSGTRRAQG